MTLRPRFWEQHHLDELTSEEWEALCDRCGKCCVVKLEDAQTHQVHYTDVACRLFDATTGGCRDYAHRHSVVPDCAVLTPETVPRFAWMPDTCAYRLMAEGKPLEPWHPLLSGDPESVHRAGISVRGRVVSELEVEEADLEDHIVE